MNVYVYVASGKIPWYLVAYDKQTGKSNVLLTTKNQGNMGIWYGRHLGHLVINVRAVNVVGTEKEKTWAWIKDGKLLPRQSPNQTPPKEAYYDDPYPKLPPRPEIFLGNVAPTSEGKAEIWARTPEAKAAAPKDPPADARPEALGWKRYAFQIEPHPIRILRLRELPGGRIFGTAGAYEGNFIFDPKTGKAEHLGKIGLSHYATAIHGNKVYMSGYPSSPVYVYDLARPWNAGRIGVSRPGGPKALPEKHPDSNPQHLVNLMAYAGAHKMYEGAVGAGGKIYFGGRWGRNGVGGGFGWWNPKTEEAGGFWKIFSNYQITHICAADEGKYIAISARRKVDVVLKKPTPNEGALFIFDVAKGEIVRRVEPVLDVLGPGPLVSVGPRVIGWTQKMGDKETSIVWSLDVRTGNVDFTRKIPFPFPIKLGSNQQEHFDYRLGPDGKIWTFTATSNGHLIRMNPADGLVEVVGWIQYGGRMAFSGNDIYLSQTPQLRRIHLPLLADAGRTGK